MTHLVRFLFLVGLGCVDPWHGVAAEHKSVITVSAATSLGESIREVAALFERSNQCTVTLNLGASSVLARQIVDGAPADVFFPADEPQMNRVENAGLLRGGTRRSILSNSLVVVALTARKKELANPIDLTQPSIKTIALADPTSVPAGVYAREYFEHAGLWAQLKSKTVACENVRAALAAVESGNADAGIVFKTDSRISRLAVVAFELTGTNSPPIHYPAAVLKGSADPRLATKFVEFLQTDAARRVFVQAGFQVISQGTKP